MSSWRIGVGCLRILTLRGRTCSFQATHTAWVFHFWPGWGFAILEQTGFFCNHAARLRLRRIPWPFVLHRVALLTDGTCCCSDVTLWLHQPKELKLFPKFNVTFLPQRGNSSAALLSSICGVQVPLGKWPYTTLAVSTLSEPLFHLVDLFCFLFDSVFAAW